MVLGAPLRVDVPAEGRNVVLDEQVDAGEQRRRDGQHREHVVLAEESLHLLAVVRELVVTLRSQLELAAVDAALGAVDVVEVCRDAVEGGLPREAGRVVRRGGNSPDADGLVGHTGLVDRGVLLRARLRDAQHRDRR